MMQKTWKSIETLALGYSYWNPGIWVLIWMHSVRAFQWIPTWQGLEGFQESLRPCALDKSILSIWRFKGFNVPWFILLFVFSEGLTIFSPSWVTSSWNLRCPRSYPSAKPWKSSFMRGELRGTIYREPLLNYTCLPHRVLARIFITGCPKCDFKKTGCPNPLTVNKIRHHTDHIHWQFK